jgi:hypothetical protein
MEIVDLGVERHLRSLHVELAALSAAAAHPNRIAWIMRIRALTEIANRLDADELVALAGHVSAQKERT